MIFVKYFHMREKLVKDDKFWRFFLKKVGASMNPNCLLNYLSQWSRGRGRQQPATGFVARYNELVVDLRVGKWTIETLHKVNAWVFFRSHIIREAEFARQSREEICVIGWREREGERDAREGDVRFKSNTKLQSVQCMWGCDKILNVVRYWISIHQAKTAQTTKFGCINTNFEFGTPISTSKRSVNDFKKLNNESWGIKNILG
jgi:hypothetical protein